MLKKEFLLYVMDQQLNYILRICNWHKWKNFKHKMIYYYFSEDTESLQLKQKFDSNSIEEQSKWGNSEV